MYLHAQYGERWAKIRLDMKHTLLGGQCAWPAVAKLLFVPVATKKELGKLFSLRVCVTYIRTCMPDTVSTGPKLAALRDGNGKC